MFHLLLLCCAALFKLLVQKLSQFDEGEHYINFGDVALRVICLAFEAPFRLVGEHLVKTWLFVAVHSRFQQYLCHVDL